MPTTTAENQRTDPDRAKDELRRAGNLGEQAVSQLVRSGADLMAALIPAALLRPAATAEVFFQTLEELLAVQRRLVEELLASYRALLETPDFTTQSFLGQSRTTGNGRLAA